MKENFGHWGEWELIELIGEGSFGKVYKARKRMLDKFHYAAVKIVSIPQNDQQLRNERANGLSEESLYDYFHSIVQEWHSEIELLETLKGVTNIVSIEDYQIVPHEEEIRWDIFIRMELLTQFNEFTFTKKLCVKDVLKLGIDICRALEYCHKINIVHRDIKPENIFVSKFGDFKLGDFGIARQLERTTTSMSKKGTNMYMAPEVYKGDHYDFTVDIYSLGLVLYRLFNYNKMPFIPIDGSNLTFSDRENSIVRRMRGEDISNPILASVDISKVILKACAFNPKDRYQSVNDFLDDLIYLHSHELENSTVVDMSVFAQSSTNKSIKSYIKEQSAQRPINENSNENLAYCTSDIIEVLSEKTSGIFGSENEKSFEHELTRGIFQGSSKTKEETTAKSEKKNDLNTEISVEPAVVKPTVIEQKNVGNSVNHNDVNIPKKPFEKRKSKGLAWVSVLGVLLLVGTLFITQGFGLFSQGNQEVEIPNVVYTSQQEAVSQLEGLGLKVSVIEKEDASQPAGTVLEQSVSALNKVTKGSSVQLTVAKAIEKVTIPEVKGMDVGQAKTQLEGLGLIVTIRQTINDAKPLGEVLSQSVTSSTKVDKGTSIELETVIHSEKITVPNVVGKSEAEAKQILSDLGLEVKIVYVINDSQTAGAVFKQSAAANSSVNAGTLIELSVYAKSELITVPAFSGKTLSTYKAEAEKLGFVITSSESYSDSIAKGSIISVNPKVGTKVSKGSKIAVVVSKGKSVETVKIPAGVGSSFATFQTNATNAGLIVSKTDKCSNTVASGLILSLNPNEGTTVNKGTTVNAVVSTGNCPWSDWVTSLPSGVSATTHDIESKTQYQYRDKETTTSSNSTLSGWTKYDEVLTGYGAWGAWQDQSIVESASTSIETRVMHEFFRFYWKTTQGTGNIAYSHTKYSSWATPTFYERLRIPSTNLSTIKYSSSGSGFYYYHAELSSLNVLYRWAGTSTSPFYDSSRLLKVASYTSALAGDYAFSNYYVHWFTSTTNGKMITEYRSRAKIYTYYFYRWSSFSAWQDAAVSSSSTREVNTRIVYRYRLK